MTMSHCCVIFYNIMLLFLSFTHWQPNAGQYGFRLFWKSVEYVECWIHLKMQKYLILFLWSPKLKFSFRTCPNSLFFCPGPDFSRCARKVWDFRDSVVQLGRGPIETSSSYPFETAFFQIIFEQLYTNSHTKSGEVDLV